MTLVIGIEHLLVLPSNVVLINSITLCLGARNSENDEKVAKLDFVIVFFFFWLFSSKEAMKIEIITIS